MTELNEDMELASPGQILKEARQTKGFSTAEAASALNLRLTLIEEIEADIFDTNLSATYVRGYLKSYAKWLSVDEQVVLDAFECLGIAKENSSQLQSFSKRVENEANDSRLMMVTWGLLLVIVAVSVIWVFQNEEVIVEEVSSLDVNIESVSKSPVSDNLVATEDTEVNADPVIASAPVSAPPVIEVKSLPADSESLPDDSESLPTESVSLSSEPVNEVIESENESKETLLTVAQSVLVMRFFADCWINVVDGTGEAVAYGVKTAGREIELIGPPPFEITLGVPEAVSLEFDGEEVDMSRYPNNRTARITLPENNE